VFSHITKISPPIHFRYTSKRGWLLSLFRVEWQAMKKCSFCAEQIQDEAIKCRFCGEFLDGSGKQKPAAKWYYSTSSVVIGLLCVGPFALPLVWLNPKYKTAAKIIITIIVIAATIWLYRLMTQMYQQIIKQIHDLG